MCGPGTGPGLEGGSAPNKPVQVGRDDWLWEQGIYGNPSSGTGAGALEDRTRRDHCSSDGILLVAITSCNSKGAVGRRMKRRASGGSDFGIGTVGLRRDTAPVLRNLQLGSQTQVTVQKC